jgi:hypothetical protein
MGKCSDCGRFALRRYLWKLCRGCFLAARVVPLPPSTRAVRPG